MQCFPKARTWRELCDSYRVPAFVLLDLSSLIKTWNCLAFDLDQTTKQNIYKWALGQEWPEGTILKKPSSYHITICYSRTGRSKELFDWSRELTATHIGFSKEIKTLVASDGESMLPLTLVCESSTLDSQAEKIKQEAVNRFGIEPVEYDSYIAHISVAVSPRALDKCIEPLTWKAVSVTELGWLKQTSKQAKAIGE